VLEGNLAKQRVQRRLRDLLAAGGELRVLDVGCVGPAPLSLWRWVLDGGASGLRLTGVDVTGVDRAERAALELGLADARFVAIEGYDLADRLAGEQFDVVVCTQVLEHVLHLDRFLADLAAVLRPGGRVLLTCDSGHFRRRVGPVRALAKWLVVRLGRERYHERGLQDAEAERAFAARSLLLSDRKYFNVHPLKWVHNHGIAADRRDGVAERWYQFELALNDDAAFVAANKALFQDLYYELVRDG